VVGPQHITTLLTALRTNTFVKHFLLGNNLIGPRGAQALADFLKDYPNNIETWYLAGCCIDAPSFKLFVDALVQSSICHSVWLKRNPFTSVTAEDVFRMITQMKSLRTLDLDQTQFGDEGTSRMFELLATFVSSNHQPLPLETLYLNANGIGLKACKSIAKYLVLPNCALKSVYLACNPIGDEGARALASGLTSNKSLLRLFLKSIGVSTIGAVAIFTALQHHPKLSVLDMSHSYTTPDLNARYNYIEDGASVSIISMITNLRTLRYLCLGYTAMSAKSLDDLKPAIRSSNLLFYQATSLHASHNKEMKEIRETLEANIKAYYGEDMTYSKFIDGSLRFLRSPPDVRYIDSVYRNRDAAKAKRKEMILEKWWPEGDGTLMEVQNA
jgi:hypothetical protein